MSGSLTPVPHTASRPTQAHSFIFRTYANVKLNDTKFNFEIHLERINKTIKFCLAARFD
jgi:hypothetical protein